VRARPRISAAATIGLVDAIEREGGDADGILRAVRLTRAAISDTDGFIPSSDFARLLELAAQATRDPCFGLHFGEGYHPKDMGPLMYVALNSPTFMVGIQNIGRYLHVVNEAGRVSLSIEGPLAHVRHWLADLEVEVPRQHNEYSLTVALNAVRLMVGSQWAPREVQFSHPAPRDTSEHLRFFRAPVSFGCATNAFIVERELLDRPIPAADSRLYPILQRYLERVLNEMPREDSLVASVRKAIGESMREGHPTLVKVARKLAMGPRTLQRRLVEQGTDFKRLVDDTRRRFSLSYLEDARHTLTDIAYLLGYSEVSAFNRAFKRWTNATPSDYRRRKVMVR
jgi:AraC-like DNA-binding protein